MAPRRNWKRQTKKKELNNQQAKQQSNESKKGALDLSSKKCRERERQRSALDSSFQLNFDTDRLEKKKSVSVRQHYQSNDDGEEELPVIYPFFFFFFALEFAAELSSKEKKYDWWRKAAPLPIWDITTTPAGKQKRKKKDGAKSLKWKREKRNPNTLQISSQCTFSMVSFENQSSPLEVFSRFFLIYFFLLFLGQLRRWDLDRGENVKNDKNVFCICFLFFRVKNNGKKEEKKTQ